MNEVVHQFLGWLEYLRGHPLIAAVVAVVLVGFYYLSTWKPKHARDAESRLREIREESLDFYRHSRPPGR